MDDTNRLHPKVLNGRYAIMFCFMLLNLQWQFSVDTYGLITLRYFRQCQRSNHGDYVEETGIKNNKTRQSTNMWLYRLKHDANLINVSGHLGVSEIFSGIICCSIASEISTRFHLL